jgi:Fe-S cluster assembly protein SufD
MFYMRQRGIQKEAKALLMYAFSNAIIESIKYLNWAKNHKIIANKLGVKIGFDL